ncbi:MAG: hypothetical protein ACYTEL_02135 [Planctomycetota bacterium]
MGVDVLVLNTGVVDFRRPDFQFADELVGEGGLAKCKIEDQPDFSQQQLAQWIKGGFATCGGPGNSAPLMAKSGLKVASKMESICPPPTSIRICRPGPPTYIKKKRKKEAV